MNKPTRALTARALPVAGTSPEADDIPIKQTCTPTDFTPQKIVNKEDRPMTTLSRTIVALSSSLLMAGALAGTANAAEAKHHARHLDRIHEARVTHDACATMVRPPDGGWWGYNLSCPHGG